MRPIVPPVSAACVLAFGFVFALSAAAIPPASGARASERGRCPSSSGATVVLTVPLPGVPRGMQLARKTLWIAIGAPRPGRPGSLVRVDAGSGRIERTFRLPLDPSRLAVAFGSLWITGEGQGKHGVLWRVDPSTGRVLKVIQGPKSFGAALAATSDAVWVGGGDIFPQGQPEKTTARLIFKIDPRRNAVSRSVRLKPTTVITLLGDRGSLWATGWGALVKLSASGRLLVQRRFNGSGWSLALAPDAIWVAQPFAGTRASRQQLRARRLLRVTTSAPHRLSVLELDSQPGAISAAADYVWMTSSPGVVRIDGAQTPPRLMKVELRGDSLGIVASKAGAWVTQHNPNALSKIC
jgi:hypothetical protein